MSMVSASATVTGDGWVYLTPDDPDDLAALVVVALADDDHADVAVVHTPSSTTRSPRRVRVRPEHARALGYLPAQSDTAGDTHGAGGDTGSDTQPRGRGKSKTDDRRQ